MKCYVVAYAHAGAVVDSVFLSKKRAFKRLEEIKQVMNSFAFKPCVYGITIGRSYLWTRDFKLVEPKK